MTTESVTEEMPGFRYQKENKVNRALPYYNKINEESQIVLAEIKKNLGKAILHREVCPGFRYWLLRLRTYFAIYGLRISKEDHATLVKLLYELTVMPGVETHFVLELIDAAFVLLKKPELLSPDDVELPWRPLYDLFRKASHVTYSRPAADQIYNFIGTVSRYFPVSATEEILAEIMPTVCPLDTAQMIISLRALSYFLPLTPRHAEQGKGYHLWIHNLMEMWEVCNNTSCMDLIMMKFMARLATDNAGRIDWEPYMDLMFTRIMRGLKLPVSYDAFPRVEPVTSADDAACWIVAVLGGGSTAQRHLTELLKSLESYFYPANSGRWSCKLHGLVSSLPEIFLKRLFYERKKDLRWMAPVPVEKRLTEDDIDAFVESLRPSVIQAINGNNTRYHFLRALYSLAWLRPSLIIPSILERLYNSVNSQTEPHRVAAGLMFVGAVVRPMVEGVRLNYSDGPLQVLPLLTTLLPCIDPNDIMKTTCAFVLLSRILTYVPLIDCSQEIGKHTDMTPIEEEICASTAGMEDFVMQMIDRILSLVHYSSLENVRQEQKSNVNSKWDTVVQATTSGIARRLVSQASPQFFKAALNKVQAFIADNVLESSVSLLGSIVSAFVSVNAEETWKVLMPPLIEGILNNTESDDVQSEETLSSELMYYLGLLNYLTQGGQLSKLFPYMPLLHKVLERTLHLENFDGHHQAQRILGNIIAKAAHITPQSLRSSDVPYDSPPGAHLHIRDWGKSVRVKDLNAQWHVPDDQEFKCVQETVNKFLPFELQLIESFIQGNDKISREALQRSLRITRSVLHCQPLLPFWEEEPLPFVGTHVPDCTDMKVETGLKGTITMPDGSNMRKSLIFLMERLQHKLLTNAEDDTLSCLLLIKVWRSLLINWVSEVTWQAYKDATKWERDPMSVPNLTRMTLISGAALQSAQRIGYFFTPFTATHAKGLVCVFELATSHYSKVRMSAQTLLNQVGERYYVPLVHQFLMPYLLKNLSVDTVEQHEVFKGTLYVLATLNATYDWKMSKDLWIKLVRSMPTEKLSVIKKLEEITFHLMKQAPITSVQIEVPDCAVETAQALWQSLPFPDEPMPSSADIAGARDHQKARNEKLLAEWTDLQTQLVEAAESRSVHWRHAYMAVSCFQRILLEEERSPPEAVRFLLSCLISDNIYIRKAAVRCVCVLLQQQKQKTKYITVSRTALLSSINGCALANESSTSEIQWLHYLKDKRPLTEKDWNNQKFIHKEYMGYVNWPEDVRVPCPSNEQPPLDAPERILKDDEMEVDKFFLSEKNVEAVISYNALEKKSHNEFVYVIYLFSKLFRNSGDKYLHLFKPHIKKLLEEKLDTHQMFLFELLAGIIRGTKRWPFAKVSAFWEWMGPVITAAQENLCVVDNECLPLRLATSQLKRDPYSHHWLVEILMDDPLRDGASILSCRRLAMVKSILTQKHWRVTSLSYRLLEYVKPFLAHPYKNVRNSVGMLMGKIFNTDFQLSGTQSIPGPNVADFISSVVPEMELLKSLNVSVHDSSNGKSEIQDMDVDDVSRQLDNVELGNSKQDKALRLFKTVSACMQEMLYHSPVALHPCFYELFELSILLENVEKDKELQAICKKNLTLLSAALTLPQYLSTALNAIHKVDKSPSWSMRASCLSFLQVLVFQNMAIFRSKDLWVKEVVNLVVTRLEDGWLEVQQKAGEVLGGLLHCHFIPDSRQLLDTLKKKAQTKLSRKNPDLAKLRMRHAGVIGLCAYVNAFPYDVPDFVPEVIGILGSHLNDPHPIPTTIRKTLSSFQRTHTADWQQHRLCFTEEQLNALSDMVLPPAHYV